MEKGIAISTEYIDTKTPLKWKCKNNHIFECDYDHLVYRNRWCRGCKKLLT